MKQKDLEINISAPIIPKIGLGGLFLRTPIRQYDKALRGLGYTRKGTYKQVHVFLVEYSLDNGEVSIFVDVRNSKIIMLSACKGYKGALFDGILVGMKVEEAISIMPELYYDVSEELLLCRSHKGISIDLSEKELSIEEVPDLTISSISVYIEEFNTPKGQSGDW